MRLNLSVLRSRKLVSDQQEGVSPFPRMQSYREGDLPELGQSNFLSFSQFRLKFDSIPFLRDPWYRPYDQAIHTINLSFIPSIDLEVWSEKKLIRMKISGIGMCEMVTEGIEGEGYERWVTVECAQRVAEHKSRKIGRERGKRTPFEVSLVITIPVSFLLSNFVDLPRYALAIPSIGSRRFQRILKVIEPQNPKLILRNEMKSIFASRSRSCLCVEAVEIVCWECCRWDRWVRGRQKTRNGEFRKNINFLELSGLNAVLRIELSLRMFQRIVWSYQPKLSTGRMIAFIEESILDRTREKFKGDFGFELSCCLIEGRV